jgi:3-dehydroquinate dehydratase-2
MNRIVYVLNGPNLNLLGKRQPHIYGNETLAAVEADCRKVAGELGLDLRFHQSNREYEIIDWIHEAREVAGGIVINPAAFTHTSVATSKFTYRTSTSARNFATTPMYPFAPTA